MEAVLQMDKNRYWKIEGGLRAMRVWLDPRCLIRMREVMITSERLNAQVS
jgi:hypothetical protein